MLIYNLYARIATQEEINTTPLDLILNSHMYSDLPEDYYSNNPLVDHKLATLQEAIKKAKATPSQFEESLQFLTETNDHKINFECQYQGISFCDMFDTKDTFVNGENLLEKNYEDLKKFYLKNLADFNTPNSRRIYFLIMLKKYIETIPDIPKTIPYIFRRRSSLISPRKAAHIDLLSKVALTQKLNLPVSEKTNIYFVQTQDSFNTDNSLGYMQDQLFCLCPESYVSLRLYKNQPDFDNGTVYISPTNDNNMTLFSSKLLNIDNAKIPQDDYCVHWNMLENTNYYTRHAEYYNNISNHLKSILQATKSVEKLILIIPNVNTPVLLATIWFEILILNDMILNFVKVTFILPDTKLIDIYQKVFDKDNPLLKRFGSSSDGSDYTPTSVEALSFE